MTTNTYCSFQAAPYVPPLKTDIEALNLNSLHRIWVLVNICMFRATTSSYTQLLVLYRLYKYGIFQWAEFLNHTADICWYE